MEDANVNEIAKRRGEDKSRCRFTGRIWRPADGVTEGDVGGWHGGE